MKQDKVSLSFVFLIYNEEKLIGETLERTKIAAKNADWLDSEIVFVDDGSTDGTVKVLEDFRLKSPIPVNLIKQKNLGRLEARKTGLNAAKGKYIVFIDARVRLHKNSLKFLKKQLKDHPERQVWNAHIDIPRSGISQAGFWYVVTYMAWKKYLVKPRYVSFGIEDFDYYPKGTGAFFVPRKMVIDAYDKLDSIYENTKFASDDTTMMRNIAKQQNINISPEYGADYIARTDLKSFIRHAYHRGTFLLDSYLRRGTRLYYLVIAYFPLSVISVIAVILFPLFILVAAAVLYCIAFLYLLINNLKLSDVLSFLVLLPLFVVFYSLGIWKGFIVLALQKISTKEHFN